VVPPGGVPARIVRLAENPRVRSRTRIDGFEKVALAPSPKVAAVADAVADAAVANANADADANANANAAAPSVPFAAAPSAPPREHSHVVQVHGL
jgi:hypothetical protein